MEEHGLSQVEEQQRPPPPNPQRSEEYIAARLHQEMNLLQDMVDSPQAQLILRNLILTLLELPEHTFNTERAYKFLTDERTRRDAVKKLAENTPSYWSEGWNALWSRDIDPLLSLRQQRIVRLTSLITFWEKYWNSIPNNLKEHVVNWLKNACERL